MKAKLFFNLILFFFFNYSFSQKISDVKGRNPYIKVEVTLTNGTVKNVLMKNIYFPRKSTFNGIIGQSKGRHGSFERNVKFEIKNSAESNSEKLTFDEVNKIKVLEDGEELIGYEKLKIKELDSKRNWEYKNYEAFLPILYEGKINIYGYTITYGEGSQLNFITNALFVKNRNQDYAVMPVDYDKLSIFNLGNIQEKFFMAYLEAGKDCENFKKYISDLESTFNSKEKYQELESEAVSNYRQIQKDAKQYKGKERSEYIIQKGSEIQLNYQIGIIREYEKNCP